MVLTALASLAAVLVPAAGSSAATAPAPVSNITVTERTAHRIAISYYGLYSARRTITVVTRPDVVTDLTWAVPVDGPTYGPFQPQVRLTWRNPAGPLKAVRIVRNTAPTTTGGTVITLAASAQSYTDAKLPYAVCQPTPSPTGCTTSPVYYWVIPESTIDGLADRYVRTDAVVGSRTITGTVSGDHERVIALCCQNPVDASLTYVAGAESDADVNGGAFTIHVPPGVYTICTESATTHDLVCWKVNPDGSGSTVVRPDTAAPGPDPTLDVRTGTTYSGVRHI